MLGLWDFFYRVFMRKNTKHKYRIDSSVLERMLKENWPNVNLWMWDAFYVFPNFTEMLKIIRNDAIKWHRYRSEVYDCDNFAVSFAGLVPYIYDINNVGVAIGKVYDSTTGKYVGYHAWNVFIAMKSDGVPMIYIYEPQSGMFSTYKSGRIGNWVYEPDFIIWG